MKAFNFYKDKTLEEVDIVIDSPVSYDKARRSLRRIRVGGISLPVISVKNLIRMKKRAGRPVDRVDVETLKMIGRFGR
jgi:hypothetical protein